MLAYVTVGDVVGAVAELSPSTGKSGEKIRSIEQRLLLIWKLTGMARSYCIM